MWYNMNFHLVKASTIQFRHLKHLIMEIELSIGRFRKRKRVGSNNQYSSVYQIVYGAMSYHGIHGIFQSCGSYVRTQFELAWEGDCLSVFRNQSDGISLPNKGIS